MNVQIEDFVSADEVSLQAIIQIKWSYILAEFWL